LIDLYFQIYSTLTSSDPDIHFKNLKKLLRSHQNELNENDKRDAFQYFFNYCIKRINKGEPEFMKELFNGYKEALENKAMFHKGKLSQWDYKNIATIGYKLCEYKWVKQFLRTYKSHLPEAEKENAWHYNRANYLFQTKKYAEAVSLLQKVNFTDLYYQLDTRAILLKIYFETEEVNAFMYHVSAFKMFLRRNTRISEYQRTIYKNLVDFTGKAFRLRVKGKSTELLTKQLNETKQVADFNWLMNQLKEV
jgi:hypothetical protein